MVGLYGACFVLRAELKSMFAKNGWDLMSSEPFFPILRSSLKIKSKWETKKQRGQGFVWKIWWIFLKGTLTLHGKSLNSQYWCWYQVHYYQKYQKFVMAKMIGYKRDLVQRENMRYLASWESPDSRGIDINLSQLITWRSDGDEDEKEDDDHDNIHLVLSLGRCVGKEGRLSD